MKSVRPILAALLALIPFGVGPAAAAKSVPHARAKPSAPAGVIALIADRRVEEADIRRAALVMAGDPLRTSQPALWRKKLLDLCVDRELLALEAERQGLLNDAAVRRRIEAASAELLYAAIQEKQLIPELTPNASQIDTARAGGLFRRVKLGYILSVTDRKATYEIYESLKNGARFDSVAPLYSVHPSASKGGELGWRRVGELNRKSWGEFRTAKPGDLMGPYFNDQSHELYKVEAIEDPDDEALRRTLVSERSVGLDLHYKIRLLQKYHFALNPEGVSSVIFASATEKADSILASLDPKGRRPKRGVHPSLGVLARVDGDSITYRELAFPEILHRDEEGKSKLEDSRDLLVACSLAMFPRLIARDARERKIDREPSVARRLRLIREEISTRAMVTRAVPAPDTAAARAYFDAHASRYRRPAARRAFVAMFASRDTARMARMGWSRGEFRDSIFTVEGFRRTEGRTAGTLFPRFYGEIPIFETDTDPLSVAVRGLEEGQISSLIETPNGYAVAKALGREATRAFAFEEARTNAWVDAREDAENAWVMSQLERLRTATPARIVPARLDAVRLGMNSDTGGNRR